MIESVWLVCLCAMLVISLVGATLNLAAQGTKSVAAAKAEQRGTDSLPVVVRVQPSVMSPEERLQESQDKAMSRLNDSRTAFWTWMMGLCAFGALVVAGLQAGFFWKQLGMMKTSLDDATGAARVAAAAAKAADMSVKIAKDTAQRELRAYLHVETVRFEFPMTVLGGIARPLPLVARIRIRNFGATPAHNVITKGNICFVPPSIAVPSPLPEFESKGEQSKDVLGPTIFHTAPATATEPLDIATQDALHANKGSLFAYGSVTYDDVFGRSHWTKFQYRYVPPRNADGYGDATSTAEGNDTDHDPPKWD
jgi:hypothetical protein